MAEKIFVDENGNELRREPLTRGRPPKGAVKMNEDGDWYKKGDIVVHPVKDETFRPECITVDAEGNVVHREPKGRGNRDKKLIKDGYVKQTDGEFEGHWLKTVTEDADDTETENVTVTTTSDVVTVTEEPAANSEV